MTRTHKHYYPNPPVYPGEILKDHMKANLMTVKALYHLTHIPVEHLVGILEGKERIRNRDALQFGQVFNLSTQFWINLEDNYRDNPYRAEEKK